MASIRVMPDRQHFLLDGEDLAALIPVRDRYGYPVDLVAWIEGEPEHWWLREGDETPILGARQLAGAEMTAAPLPIYPTPANWAASGGDGVCVLDWDMDLVGVFDGLTLDVGHLPMEVAEALAVAHTCYGPLRGTPDGSTQKNRTREIRIAPGWRNARGGSRRGSPPDPMNSSSMEVRSPTFHRKAME